MKLGGKRSRFREMVDSLGSGFARTPGHFVLAAGRAILVLGFLGGQGYAALFGGLDANSLMVTKIKV